MNVKTLHEFDLEHLGMVGVVKQLLGWSVKIMVKRVNKSWLEWEQCNGRVGVLKQW